MTDAGATLNSTGFDNSRAGLVSAKGAVAIRTGAGTTVRRDPLAAIRASPWSPVGRQRPGRTDQHQGYARRQPERVASAGEARWSASAVSPSTSTVAPWTTTTSVWFQRLARSCCANSGGGQQRRRRFDPAPSPRHWTTVSRGRSWRPTDWPSSLRSWTTVRESSAARVMPVSA